MWSRLAVAALSDLTVYPAPVFLSLADFNHVQASVFQVSRTPGKNTVYLGSLLLVLGVFSMFYIWIAASGSGSSRMKAEAASWRP